MAYEFNFRVLQRPGDLRYELFLIPGSSVSFKAGANMPKRG